MMNNPVSRLLTVVVFVAMSLTHTLAQSPPTPPVTSAAAGKSLKDSIRPAVKSGGFAMEGYFIWCSSVIKVGDTYHLFASRWPGKYGLAGWTTYSECVRATSKNLLGPYEFAEVVLQKGDGEWDSERVHNVKIVRAGEKFVLFYISTANETGYAVADSITGPWKRSDSAVITFSNPAPLVRADGSIYCFGRKAVKNVRIALACEAPTYSGPYRMLGDGKNMLPDDCELEDPTIWWANNQYNVLVTDFGGGHATGINKAGAQYFSKDGLHYQLMSSEPVFAKSVQYDDGTTEAFQRRERPFVYVNANREVTALFTACMPDNRSSRVVVQPVDRYVPNN